MLDADLAALYGVTTKRLNEQVRRNLARFPADFVFQLTDQEVANLRSQFATSSSETRRLAWGGRRYAPHAFTEHGTIMAAMVLNSPRATEVSVYVVRAFVQLRDTLIAHKELAQRLNELEAKIEGKLSTHDQAIAGILDAIRQLMAPPEPRKKRPIGFLTSKEMKLQCGGLQGVQRALAHTASVIPPANEFAPRVQGLPSVADVRGLVEAAQEKFDGVQNLPYFAIVQSVVAYQIRRCRLPQ